MAADQPSTELLYLDTLQISVPMTPNRARSLVQELVNYLVANAQEAVDGRRLIRAVGLVPVSSDAEAIQPVPVVGCTGP